MTLHIDHYSGRGVKGIEQGADSDHGPWYGIKLDGDAMIIVNGTEPPVDMDSRMLANVIYSSAETRMVFAKVVTKDGKPFTDMEDTVELSVAPAHVRVTDPQRPEEASPEPVIDDGSVEVVG